MNELQIKEKDGKLFTSSKEIAGACGKRHDHVIRDLKDEFEGEISTTPNLGALIFESYYTDQKGEKRPMYILDEYAALRLCARYSKEIRKNVVEAFKQAREKLTAIERDPLKIFENATVEQTQYLIHVLQEKLDLQKQVQEMKPALDYCDKILTCSKTETYTATQIVKTLGLEMTVHELNEYLVKKGFLLDQSYTNKNGKLCHKYYPTAKASRGGYVEFYNFEDRNGANRCAFKFTEKCRTAIFKGLEKEVV